MKKQLLFGALLVATLLSVATPVHAAWELLKNEASGTNYIDNSSYKCSCRNPDVAYFKLKQIPTHSNAKYVLYNIKLNFDNGMVYTYATRYYNSGYVEDTKIPPMPGRAIGRDTALAAAIYKVGNYCDNYCKGR